MCRAIIVTGTVKIAVFFCFVLLLLLLLFLKVFWLLGATLLF